MPRRIQPLALGALLITIALLAIFGIIPEKTAQFAPLALLALVPRVWLGTRQCCLPAGER